MDQHQELVDIVGRLTMTIFSDIHTAAQNSIWIEGTLGAILVELQALNLTQAAMAADVKRIADSLTSSPVVGIAVIETPHSEREDMSKMNLTKAPKGKPASRATAGANAPTISNFNLVDNGNNNYTVVGVDAAGNQVDISGVAALAATSDNPAVMGVAVSGMSFTVTAASNPAPSVGDAATITLTATWNDGSIGPFTATIKGTITGGPVINIAVV